MFVGREAQDHVTDEYGGRFRRLYPWEGVTMPPWGGAIMTIAPGENSLPHDHDEEETFIFLSGEGAMSVDDETRPVGKGDVACHPRRRRPRTRRWAMSEKKQLSALRCPHRYGLGIEIRTLRKSPS